MSLLPDGYFQSERYFKAIRSKLRNEFSLRIPPAGANRALLDRISSCVSVSVHIRRGDYVSNVKAALIHGTCPIEYYRRATEAIFEKAPSGEFFVFSTTHFGLAKILMYRPRFTSSAITVPMPLMKMCV